MVPITRTYYYNKHNKAHTHTAVTTVTKKL